MTDVITGAMNQLGVGMRNLCDIFLKSNDKLKGSEVSHYVNINLLFNFQLLLRAIITLQKVQFDTSEIVI